MASVQAELENVKRELAATSAALVKIGKDTEEWKTKIGDFNPKLEAIWNITPSVLKEALEYLRDEKRSLRDEENKLLEKENKLRDEKKSLIDEETLLGIEKAGKYYYYCFCCCCFIYLFKSLFRFH